MKINKLIIENINSLKGRFEIDFTASPFAENSLFAITGPTGSGKSTLLDAISLALFNKVPRFGKISKTDFEAGTLINYFTDTAMAEVHYQSKGKDFISKWTVRKKRTGNWDDYNLEVFDGQGIKLTQKKTEAVEFNEQNIGLNFDQFIQSLLLSQGAFQKFLLSKEDERSQLLEQITGTSIYRALSIRAREKSKAFKNEIQDLETRLQEHPEVDDVLIESKKEAISQLLKNQEAQDLIVKAAEENVLLLNKHQELKIQLKGLQDTADKLKTQKEKVNEYRKKLELHQELQAIVPAYEQLKENQKSEKQLQEEQKTLIQEENRLNAEQKSFNEHLESFFEIQSGDWKKVIESWVEACNILKNEGAKLTQEGKMLKQNLEDFKDLPQEIVAFKQKSNYSADLLQFTTKTEEILKEKTSNIAPEQLEEHRLKTKQEIQVWQKYINDFKDYQRNFKDLQLLEGQIQQNQEKLKLAKKNLDQFDKQLQEALAKLKPLEEATLNANHQELIELLRSQLKDGSACDVCGATDHPFAQQQDPLNWAIKITEKDALLKEIKTLESHLEKEKLNGKHLQQLLDEASSKKEVLNQQCKNQIALLAKTHNPDQINESEIEQKIKILEKEEDNINLQKQYFDQLKVINRYKDLLNHLFKVRAFYKKHTDEDCKAKKYKEDYAQIASRYLSNLSSIETTAKHLKTQKSTIVQKLDTTSTVIKTLEKEVLTFIQQYHWTEIGVLEDHLLKSEVLSNVVKGIEQYDSQVAQNQKQLEETEKLLSEEHFKNIEELPDLVTLKEQLLQFKQIASQIHQDIGTKRAELKQLEETKAKRNELLKAIEQRKGDNHKWVLLDDLIGSADGKKFNKIAQRLSLKQLLIRANSRLIKFNDRYSFNLDSLEQDYLEIVDHYMADTTRSIKSLSGGETFLLSLCMALSLSDMAATGNKMETLFIDEGFGTLDEDALESALGLLEKVQQEEGKVVGIISHVASIKERIPTQVQLIKNNQGSSTLRIVS